MLSPACEPSTGDPVRQEEPELEKWTEWGTTGKGKHIILTYGDTHHEHSWE